MNRIVLLLSGGGRLANAADAAADAARQEGAEVVVLYVIDQEVPASVSSWLIYVGFMGDVPSDDYRHTILKEYCRRAQEDLDEAAARLTAAGVSRKLSPSLLST